MLNSRLCCDGEEGVSDEFKRATWTNLEDDALALEDLITSVTSLSHEDKLVDAAHGPKSSSALHSFTFFSSQTDIPRCHNLLILSRNEHGRNSNKLKLDETNNSVRKESINNVDGDPKRFG